MELILLWIEAWHKLLIDTGVILQLFKTPYPYKTYGSHEHISPPLIDIYVHVLSNSTG